jgi:hypothetical protein
MNPVDQEKIVMEETEERREEVIGESFQSAAVGRTGPHPRGIEIPDIDFKKRVVTGLLIVTLVLAGVFVLDGSGNSKSSIASAGSSNRQVRSKRQARPFKDTSTKYARLIW